MKKPLFYQLSGFAILDLKLNCFRLPILILASAFAHQAQADIYKCTYLDDAKRAKTVYTDAPCGKTAQKSLSDIRATSEENASKTQLVASKVLPKQTIRAVPSSPDSIDQAVTRAVLAEDFKLAKQLATSKEHWRLIAIAEKPDAPTSNLPKLEQAVYSQNNTNHCDQAKADFGSTSRLNWRDKDLINAKRSLMYANCDIAEPVQPNTIIVGQSYPLGWLNNGHSYVQQYGAGITTGRWIAPNAYGFGHHAYRPQTHHHNHASAYAPQGLSIGYQNRHIGVQFGSFSTSSTTGDSNSTNW